MDSSFQCADARLSVALADNCSPYTCTFEELFEQLKPFVDQSAKKRHGPNQRVALDDLKQAGYIALWRAHESYDPNAGVPIEHYARRAVVNAIISECRHSPSPEEILYGDFDAGDGGEYNDATFSDMVCGGKVGFTDPIFELCAAREVSAIVSVEDVSLTTVQRTILDLLYHQGLSTQDAAALLHVSHQAVSKQHRKAIDACRQHLGVIVH